jgi:hypothetical protein
MKKAVQDGLKMSDFFKSAAELFPTLAAPVYFT